MISAKHGHMIKSRQFSYIKLKLNRGDNTLSRLLSAVPLAELRL
jgi:hypothetical protein